MTRSVNCYWPLDDAHLRWYAYARVAWWHLLSALRFQPGDHILMPDLICDVMTEPLGRLGLQPRYYRSEPLGRVTAAELTPHFDDHTRAVLAVHYFGLPTDVSEAAALCREVGVPLIEDASQAMLSQDQHRPIGHHGSAVLFSFRKTLRLPHGAGLICQDAALDRALNVTSLQLSKPRRDVWRYWAKRLDRQCFGGNCEQFLDAVRARRPAGYADLATTASSPDPFEPCLVRPGRTARWLVSRWDLHKEIHRRRERFSQLARRWQKESLPGRPLVTSLARGWVPYAFVLEPDDSGAERTCRKLQAIGIAAEPWPRLPADAHAGVSDRRKVLLIL
jgi:hypothetical protein